MKFLDKKELLYLIIPTSLAAVFIFYQLGQNHLIEYDEGIYALVAKNILKTGDWFTLHWRLDLPWFDKGPLYLWLTALSLRLFGETAWAVRLWSAVSGVLGVVSVFLIARKLYNRPTTAFLAATILASTTGYLYYARNGMLDVPNATFNSLSVLFLIYSLESGFYLYPASATLALGFLNRGPLALLGLVSFVIWLFLSKRTVGYGWRRVVGSLVIFLAIISPWHLVETLRHGREFWQVYLSHQMLLRFAQSIEGKGAPFLWYGEVVRFQFRIWFLFLIPALVYGFYRLRKGNLADAFVLIWSLTTFLVFTLAKSKLIWYILPLYVPLSILVASFLDRLLKELLPPRASLVVVFLAALAYNLYMWASIKTRDFTYDQVSLIEEKNRLSPQANLLVAGYGFSVSSFYARGPVKEVPAEELYGLLDGVAHRYALISLGDFARLSGKFDYKIIAAVGDGILITR